ALDAEIHAGAGDREDAFAVIAGQRAAALVHRDGGARDDQFAIGGDLGGGQAVRLALDAAAVDLDVEAAIQAQVAFVHLRARLVHGPGDGAAKCCFRYGGIDVVLGAGRGRRRSVALAGGEQGQGGDEGEGGESLHAGVLRIAGGSGGDAATGVGVTVMRFGGSCVSAAFIGLCGAIHGGASVLRTDPARPSVAGRSAGHAAVPPSVGWVVPSMAVHPSFGSIRPGHPWPGVRRARTGDRPVRKRSAHPSSRHRRRRMAAKIIAAPAATPPHSWRLARLRYTPTGFIRLRAAPGTSKSTFCRYSRSMKVMGKMLVSARSTMLRKNGQAASSNTPRNCSQATKMPANSGIMIAHRNGLLRAQDEHSISQPMVGMAHSA